MQVNSAIFVCLAVSIAAYALGNIPFSVYVAKLAGHDIYETGSKNPGASNVARIAGWKWGALAMVLDILKGFVPTVLVLAVAQQHFVDQTTRIIAYFAAGCAIAGHVVPVGRKGGKGIATGAGSALALVPLAGIAMVFVWFSVIKITKLPVIASITAALVLPIWLLIDQNYMWECAIAMGLFAFVVLRHLPNLIRLARRQESAVTKHGREQYQQKTRTEHS